MQGGPVCVRAPGIQIGVPLAQLGWRKDSWVCKKILSSDLGELGCDRAQVSSHSQEALAYIHCLFLQTFCAPLGAWHSVGAMQGAGLSETITCMPGPPKSGKEVG